MRYLVGLVIAASLVVPRLAFAEVEGEEEPKSENVAFGLAFSGTLVSMVALPTAVLLGYTHHPALGTASLLVAVAAPSMGTLYSGDAGNVLTTGLAIRGVGAAVIAAEVVATAVCTGDDRDEGCVSDWQGRAMLAAAGAVVVGGVFDWVAAPRAVRAHNARLRDVTIAPVVTDTSTSLVLSGRF